MNQMGPQSPALETPLIYKTYSQLPKVFHDVFHKFHVTEMTTKMCFEHGELPFSGSFPSNMKYDPESYLFSANDFKLVSGTFKGQESIL